MVISSIEWWSSVTAMIILTGLTVAMMVGYIQHSLETVMEDRVKQWLVKEQRRVLSDPVYHAALYHASLNYLSIRTWGEAKKNLDTDIENLHTYMNRMSRAISYLSQQMCKSKIDVCQMCHMPFLSRNALFRHLRDEPTHVC